MEMIKTFAEARILVRKLQICTIFASEKSDLPSLWEHVDLPEKREGEKGWGQKVSAVWDWKNRLPATFPNEIFYGKIKGGFAVLMTFEYLRDVHFPTAYTSIYQLNRLAEQVYDKIRMEPWETGPLRREAMDEFGCTKSRFDTALKNLQISMNIARLNEPGIERDTWLAFSELYPDIWRAHVTEE